LSECLVVLDFPERTSCLKGHAVAQLVEEALRYSREVAGSIPHGAIGIFH
jgi:hypothetical protein